MKKRMSKNEKRKQEIADHIKEMYDYDPMFIGDPDEATAYIPAIIGLVDSMMKTEDGKCVSVQRICYDYDKLIECMMKYNKWSHEDAVEWFDYNTARSLPYIENSPLIFYNEPWKMQ